MNTDPKLKMTKAQRRTIMNLGLAISNVEEALRYASDDDITEYIGHARQFLRVALDEVTK